MFLFFFFKCALKYCLFYFLLFFFIFFFLLFSKYIEISLIGTGFKRKFLLHALQTTQFFIFFSVIDNYTIAFYLFIRINRVLILVFKFYKDFNNFLICSSKFAYYIRIDSFFSVSTCAYIIYISFFVFTFFLFCFVLFCIINLCMYDRCVCLHSYLTERFSIYSNDK